jgi:hypothetical protein
MFTKLVRSGGAILALAVLSLPACGGDGDGGGGPGGGGGSTTFTGVLSQDDGSGTGSVEFTVQTGSPAPPAGFAGVRDPVNVTGTVKLNGTTSVNGDYDPDTGQLTATGGGFIFGGFYDGTSRLEGGWTGPGGTSGTFVTTKGNSASAFCGTYDEEDDGSVDGTFSFVISNGSLLGERYAAGGGAPVPLEGVVNGNSITVYFPGTTTTLAVGTRNGNSVSGSFDDLQGNTGSWQGSTTACQ